jgi:hydroxymethylpyrimidine pyrophosphatase-like HAD family hydrolase
MMGIGDSGNDLSMLEKVGYPYAMANGSDIVKKTAKYHTTRYNQNGLGMAITDYLFRTKNLR